MPDSVTPASFTLANYRHYLELAHSCGYTFRGFHESEASSSREILLRHDIDYAPRFAPPLAEIEAGLGVRATYCVLLDCPWYRLHAPRHRAALRAVLDCGHWLGLHFDASAIASDDDVRRRVIEDAARLGAEFDVQVQVVSFHNPGRRPVAHLTLPEPLIHTYSRPFFQDIAYISDSNQDWRGNDLAAVLRRRQYLRLQLLIHPFWWRQEPMTLGEKLRGLADELGIGLEDLAQPEHLEIIASEEAGAS